MGKSIQRNTGKLEFDSVADLRAFAGGTGLRDDESVLLLGYYADGDMDSRVLRWDDTATTTDDGGKTFKLTALTTGRFFDDSDSTSVKDYGAKGDGTTLDTTSFEGARDSGARLILIPRGTYRIEGLSPGNRMHWKGVGTREDGTVLVSNTLNKGIFEFTDGPAESIFEGVNFDATVLGVAAFVNTDGFANYMQNCDIINCVFLRSLRYGIKANMILNVIDRCNFMQHGSPQGSQDVTAIHTEWDGSSNTVNINTISKTNIYNTQGVAVHIKRGFLFKFELVTFESITGPAVEALGVDNLEFDNCWFESIDDADHAVDLQLDTVGSNAAFINCKFDNNASTTYAQIVSVGSACTAKFERCSGNLASAFLSKKSGVFDDGLSYTLNNTFTNYTGDRSDRFAAKSIIINSGPETFSLRNTALTDAPGSPETVATFTVPDHPGSGQNTYSALIECQLIVNATMTTNTDSAQNIQKADLHVFRGADGAISTSFSASGSTDNVTGVAFWTSAPVWSVTTSGDDVLLKVTSNPAGGSFTNGIKATVNCTIGNSSASGGGGVIATS